MINAGLDLPFPWRERPIVENQGYEWYLEAFSDLSSCRNIGFSVGQIPWTAIIKYIELEEIEDVNEFKQIISALDTVFLDYANQTPDKNKKQDKRKK